MLGAASRSIWVESSFASAQVILRVYGGYWGEDAGAPEHPKPGPCSETPITPIQLLPSLSTIPRVEYTGGWVEHATGHRT